MAKPDHIPAPAVRRLSLYLRQLESFLALEKQTISSKELGKALDLSDAQVRKDLAYFGQFGYPGVGYRVGELCGQIRKILGTDRISKMMLIGAGNLGRALAAHRGFLRRGFQLVAAFDKDPTIVGTSIDGHQGISVLPLDKIKEVVRDHSVTLAILAVPADAAQNVTDDIIRAGIRGILNFAPVALKAPADVTITNVDLATQLEQLSFKLAGEGMA